MDAAGQLLTRGIRMLWDELFVLVIATGLWALVGLAPPLLATSLGVIAGLVVLLISLPPATAGVYFVTNRLAHDRVAGAGHFIEGMKRFAVPAWLLMLLNVMVVGLVMVNLRFYAQFEAAWVVVAQSLWLAALIVWSIDQFFVFPVLIEQDEAKPLLALRNSLLIAFGNPAVTLTVLSLVGSILGVLVFLAPRLPGVIPLFLLMPPIAALFANIAIVDRLKALRGEPDLEADS